MWCAQPSLVGYMTNRGQIPIEFVIYMINMGDITFVNNRRIKVKNHDDAIIAFEIPPRPTLFI